MFLDPMKEFLGILNETHKLYFKNKKLMFFNVIFPMFFHSILYLCSFLLISPLAIDLNTKLLLLTDYNTLQSALQEMKSVVLMGCLYMAIASLVSVYFITTLIHASATTRKKQNISLKALLYKACFSFKQTIITFFYVTLLRTGYSTLFFLTLIPIATLFSYDSLVYKFMSVLGIGFDAYLAIVWNLSLVVSVVEENCYGIEAIGKANDIVVGFKIQGFLLNSMVSVLALVFYNVLVQVWMFIGFKQSRVVVLIVCLVVLNGSLAITMFLWTAYTVVYSNCKRVKVEEEMEKLQERVEYSKVSTDPVISV